MQFNTMLAKVASKVYKTVKQKPELARLLAFYSLSFNGFDCCVFRPASNKVTSIPCISRDPTLLTVQKSALLYK